MNRKLNNILIALCIPAILLSGCSGNTQTTSQSAASSAESLSAETSVPEPTEKSLVTLGDSISFGYGTDNPDTERYSALVSKTRSEQDGINWTDYNYAVVGDDSSDLLKKLNNGRAIRLPSADVVVLYIGANNLLGVYSQYLESKSDALGIDVSDPTQIDSAAAEEIRDKLESQLDNEEQVFKDMQALIDGNLERLETDLEDIYTFIRDRNADADVYVLNIYEPYTADEDAGIIKDNTAFYSFSADQIARANQVIADFNAKHDDLIPVDIHAAFSQYDIPPVIGNGGDSPQAGSYSFYDPHPTAEGQRCIADALLKVMEAQK